MARNTDLEKRTIEIGNLLVKSFIERMVLDGELTEQDLRDPKKISEALIELSSESAQYLIAVDHSGSLLDRAIDFKNSGNTDLAFVFFGTFFEHSINRVLVEALAKKGVAVRTKNEIIRSLKIAAKFSWFLEVLDLPKFNIGHFKTVVKVAEARNAFIHYKFNYEDVEINKSQERYELLEAAEKTAIYTKRFVSKSVYGGKKLAVKKKINETFKNP